MLCHCFNYNIEQVYKCYVCYNITIFLQKKGLLELVDYYPENIEELEGKEIYLDQPNMKLVKEFGNKKWSISIDNSKNTPTFKQFKMVFETQDGKPLDYKMNLVLSFYENNDGHSTVGFSYFEYSKGGEDFIDLYNREYPKEGVIKSCSDIEKYLSLWNKPQILMESILINTNLTKISRKLIDGSAFLKLPSSKGFDLIIDRREGLVGTIFCLRSKIKKIFFVVIGIEETANYINVILKRKSDDSSTEVIDQLYFSKLNETSTLFQCYLKIEFPLCGQEINLFQENLKKRVFGFKQIFEK